MIDRIKISREFKDSILGNLWIGAEATIDEREDVSQAFVKANEELVNAYGRLSGGNDVPAYWPSGEPFVLSNGTTSKEIPTIQVSKTDKAIQSIADEIIACQDETTLKTYEKISRSDEALKIAYDLTMKKIQFYNQSNLTV